ncbi:MAG: ATP-binding cassette domain-containing protein [Acidimicrobiia bacterium]|nr:ATP-binding cassette domain-containing protein [Acidimicrobiia bacterium]
MKTGLRIDDVAKRYGEVVAIDGLTIDVRPGSMIGFLGPNGSGKTTTMRAVMGMVRLDRGTITWDGATIDDKARSRIGYMPQDRGLYARMKVREQVVYFARLAGLSKAVAAERADHWLDRVGLADRADSLTQELSGGNQQRVQLAVALVHDPDLLILDEPFSGLDPVAVEALRAIISERADDGAGVLFSSHQLDLVEGLCDEVVVIAQGRQVAAGLIRDLRAASPRRRLRVQWREPVGDWRPVIGSLAEFDGVTADVDLSADADFEAAMVQAMAAGPVSEIGIEPPGLDELFAHWVAASSLPSDPVDLGSAP